MTHELVDGTLYREKDAIVGRCTCGWSTDFHFTSFGASAAYQEHLEDQEIDDSETWPG